MKILLLIISTFLIFNTAYSAQNCIAGDCMNGTGVFKYKDLPKEFMDAVAEWRVNEDLPQPSIIRYVGGFNDEIELVN